MTCQPGEKKKGDASPFLIDVKTLYFRSRALDVSRQFPASIV